MGEYSLLIGLCDSNDDTVFEKFCITELMIYPTKEVSKIIENASRNQNDKVLATAELKNKCKSLKFTQRNLKELKLKNYRLNFNNEQLKKQIDALSRKLTLLESRKEKEEELDRKSDEVELKSFQLRLNQSEERERRLRDEISRNENKNLNLLRRKENLMSNLKQELAEVNLNLKEANKELLCLKQSKQNMNDIIEQDDEENIEQNGDLEHGETASETETSSKQKNKGISLQDHFKLTELKAVVSHLKNELEDRAVNLKTSHMHLGIERSNFENLLKERDFIIEDKELKLLENRRQLTFLERKVNHLRLENEKIKICREESFLCNDMLEDSLQNSSQNSLILEPEGDFSTKNSLSKVQTPKLEKNEDLAMGNEQLSLGGSTLLETLTEIEKSTNHLPTKNTIKLEPPLEIGNIDQLSMNSKSDTDTFVGKNHSEISDIIGDINNEMVLETKPQNQYSVFSYNTYTYKPKIQEHHTIMMKSHSKEELILKEDFKEEPIFQRLKSKTLFAKKSFEKGKNFSLFV